MLSLCEFWSDLTHMFSITSFWPTLSVWYFLHLSFPPFIYFSFFLYNLLILPLSVILSVNPSIVLSSLYVTIFCLLSFSPFRTSRPFVRPACPFHHDENIYSLLSHSTWPVDSLPYASGLKKKIRCLCFVFFPSSLSSVVSLDTFWKFLILKV